MPRVLTIGRRLAEIQRQVLAALASGTPAGRRAAVGGDLLLEALGHQRLLRRRQLVDVFAEDAVPLALGVEQFDGVCVSAASRPVNVRPSMVATVY